MNFLSIGVYFKKDDGLWWISGLGKARTCFLLFVFCFFLQTFWSLFFQTLHDDKLCESSHFSYLFQSMWLNFKVTVLAER